MTIEDAIELVDANLPGAELRLRNNPAMQAKSIRIYDGQNRYCDVMIPDVEIRAARCDIMALRIRDAIEKIKSLSCPIDATSSPTAQ